MRRTAGHSGRCEANTRWRWRVARRLREWVLAMRSGCAKASHATRHRSAHPRDVPWGLPARHTVWNTHTTRARAGRARRSSGGTKCRPQRRAARARACKEAAAGPTSKRQQRSAHLEGRGRTRSATAPYSVPKKGCWWHADENVHAGSSFVMNCDYFPFRLPLRYRVALGRGWWAWAGSGDLG